MIYAVMIAKATKTENAIEVIVLRFIPSHPFVLSYPPIFSLYMVSHSLLYQQFVFLSIDFREKCAVQSEYTTIPARISRSAAAFFGVIFSLKMNTPNTVMKI